MKIKVKEKLKGTIKTIDKSRIVAERIKDSIVNIKEKEANINSSDNNTIDYASDKIKYVANRSADESINQFNKIGKKSFDNTKDNIIKTKNKINELKIKYSEKKYIKDKLIKSPQRIKKGSNRAIKTTNKTVKSSVKITNKTIKVTERAKQLAIKTTRNTVKGIKVGVKATISAIKGVIAGTKALISLLIAGGWVAIIFIIIICLIGLLCGSIFGVFFSSEKNGNVKTMNMVVSELNQEVANRILQIQKNSVYDDYEIESNRAEWKEILSIYAVKVSNGTNATEVLTLNDSKIKTLKEVFWDMNEITSEVKTEMRKSEDSDIAESKKILYIKIKKKTIDNMARKYNFGILEKNQLNDLLREEYSQLWSSVIFGTSLGSPSIVEIALSQVGNVGGQPYWSWYGFKSRVEWCAVFVSWVANEAGYLESGIIPKFAGVSNGINWFKAVGQWKNKGYIPKPGDIIFFDWEVDNSPDHTGIVEKVENNRVYTIEGNSTDDTSRRKDYDINSKVIFGYGTPAY